MSRGEHCALDRQMQTDENGCHLHSSEVTSGKAARHCWPTKYYFTI